MSTPFLANVSSLYPLKKLENQRFSGYFKGYIVETVAKNRLMYIFLFSLIFEALQVVLARVCASCLQSKGHQL